MSEIIVIFRQDGPESASPSSLNCPATSTVTIARHISTLVNTVPPTTTSVFPRVIPPHLLTTETCSMSWNGGDTTWWFASVPRPPCTKDGRRIAAEWRCKPQEIHV